MRWLNAVLLTALLGGCAKGPEPASPAAALPREPASAVPLLTHVQVLAADSLYGRRAGSPHELAAAEYIRQEYARYGLLPAVPDYFQPFTFGSKVEMGAGNALGWSRYGSDGFALKPAVDFQPLGFSASQEITGPLVFAGYGISKSDLTYDDYAELDVTDKVVLLLRYSPDGTNPHGPFSAHMPLRKKALAARERGALAVLLVTGAADDEEDGLLGMRYDRAGDAGLPVVNLTRAAADRMLAGEHLSIDELQQEINASRVPLSHAVRGVEVTLRSVVVPVEETSRNVLATLPGAGNLRGQWVIMGAHYDHLGWGGHGSGSFLPDSAAIHNGADDNASGVATMLEVARYLAANPPAGEHRRSVMFQAFGAEELGLLGSAHVTRNSPVPMDSIVAMVNLDMVGRLTDRMLVLGGAGSSPLWKELLPRLNSDRLKLVYDDDGFRSSDHQSYYLKDKPVLFFFTGQHGQYHRPSDDVEYLNVNGMALIGRLVSRVIGELVTRVEAPAFTKVASNGPTRGGFAVAVGTLPDYTYTGEGMRLSGTRGSSPADRGGLLAGDVIVRMGTTEVLSLYDYMYALQEAKVGVALPVVVKRDGRELELEVVPERRRD